MHGFQRLLGALALLFPVLAHAGVELVVRGVDDPLRQAVVSGVDLSQYGKRAVSAAQMRRLYDEAPDQARAALQPYGYYDATVQGQLTHTGQGNWRVVLQVRPGPPVKVGQVQLELDRKVQDIGAIAAAAREVRRLQGQVLNDGNYTRARDRLSAALSANGFLGAKMTTHRVEVHRDEQRAVVKLAWQPGPRYRFGRTTFDGSQFEDGFLRRYLTYREGDYFSQNDLLALQEALNGADYFSVVNVVPQVHDAGARVDVQVQLKPAKRSVYTGGPFFGTDTGAGVRTGLERRWVNDRGHKWKNELVLAQRLKTLTSLYEVPLPGRDRHSLNFGVNLRDANTTTSRSRTIELVANDTRQWHNWTRSVGAHVLSGTFTIGQRGNEPVDTPGIVHGHSTLVYAEGSLSRKVGDNPTFVRHGWSLDLYARSTVASVLSDTAFSQVGADAKWINAFAGDNRLILRGSVGTTWVKDFSQLPPQLRFFAGGDRSVRGYGYQSIGPRNAYDRVIGGRNLLVASTEVEHYFTPHWGMAAFVDAGNAFDGTDFRPRVGAGLGVRWLSPVGMIRVDVGVPVHDARARGYHLHVTIGPDL